MTTGNILDLRDIQGNVVKAYPHDGMPKARYVFFAIHSCSAGRAFVGALTPYVSTSIPWVERGSKQDGSAMPSTATNVAFTFEGLRRLGLPQESLLSFPEEFATGMRARKDILGDDGPSAPDAWDPIWTQPDPVHMMVAISGASDAAIAEQHRVVKHLLASVAPGVEALTGHRGDGDEILDYQDTSVIYVDGQPTDKEHFGYTDGISNPYFEGAGTDPANVIGGGKVTGRDIETIAGWAPIATGEFLLGYKDEAFELPEAPVPTPLATNGSYLVYRKLHQNVGSFDAYLDRVGNDYPDGKEAFAAKLAGRWRNGAPLANFPKQAEAEEYAARWGAARKAIFTSTTQADREAAKRLFATLNVKFVAFDYSKDIDGGACPMGSHVRRIHPRSAYAHDVKFAFVRPDALSNRRRLLRRGLPYGDSQGRERKDSGNHGIIFMAICASIRRQFEFVQQQWANYGNDSGLSNDKDPLIGNHCTDADGEANGRMVIESEVGGGRPPFFCSKLPRFVETRGGDYFFVPSITALNLIADGMIDPT
jgi:Dyp-type peroxidase family